MERSDLDVGTSDAQVAESIERDVSAFLQEVVTDQILEEVISELARFALHRTVDALYQSAYRKRRHQLVLGANAEYRWTQVTDSETED